MHSQNDKQTPEADTLTTLKFYHERYVELTNTSSTDLKRLLFVRFKIIEAELSLGVRERIYVTKELIRIAAQMREIYGDQPENMAPHILEVCQKIANYLDMLNHPAFDVLQQTRFAEFANCYVNANNDFANQYLFHRSSDSPGAKKVNLLLRTISSIDNIISVVNPTNATDLARLLLLLRGQLANISFELFQQPAIELSEKAANNLNFTLGCFEKTFDLADQLNIKIPLKFHFSYLTILGTFARANNYNTDVYLKQIHEYISTNNLESRVNDEELKEFQSATSPEDKERIKLKYHRYRSSLCVHQFASPQKVTLYARSVDSSAVPAVPSASEVCCGSLTQGQ